MQLTGSPPATITLCCLMCEGKHKQMWKIHPLLSSSNTLTARALLGRHTRRKWRGSAECDVTWRFCKCYKFKRANVVLVLTKNCEFNQTKLGRGSGEYVEEAPKVLSWCKERNVFVNWMRRRQCDSDFTRRKYVKLNRPGNTRDGALSPILIYGISLTMNPCGYPPRMSTKARTDWVTMVSLRGPEIARMISLLTLPPATSAHRL